MEQRENTIIPLAKQYPGTGRNDQKQWPNSREVYAALELALELACHDRRLSG